jgi:hypothetical protein
LEKDEEERDRTEHDSLCIKKEVELLKEIKDIRDEFNIMLVLFHDQMKVLTVLEEIEKSFRSGGVQNNGGVEKDHDKLYSRPLSLVKSKIEDSVANSMPVEQYTAVYCRIV